MLLRRICLCYTALPAITTYASLAWLPLSVYCLLAVVFPRFACLLSIIRSQNTTCMVHGLHGADTIVATSVIEDHNNSSTLLMIRMAERILLIF